MNLAPPNKVRSVIGQFLAAPVVVGRDIVSGSNASQVITRRRQRPLGWLGLTTSGVLFGLLSLHPARPAFVWNFSPSVPQGLYALSDAEWSLNDLVAVAPSGQAKVLLAEYSVLAPSRVLLKRVAAVADDVVCRTSTSVTINGVQIATARQTTSEGRDLPVWSGCTRLPAGRVFLLADHPSSFDGRYFGPTPAADILGVSRALWTSALSSEEPR